VMAATLGTARDNRRMARTPCPLLRELRGPVQRNRRSPRGDLRGRPHLQLPRPRGDGRDAGARARPDAVPHIHVHVIPKIPGPYPPAEAPQVIPSEEREELAARLRQHWRSAE